MTGWVVLGALVALGWGWSAFAEIRYGSDEPATAPEQGVGPPSTPADPKPSMGAPDPSPTAAPAESEPEVVLYLKDGSRVQGFLVSASPTEVVVRVAGVRAPFRAELLERYDVLPPLMTRYEELRRAAGDDPDQTLQLARWLQYRQRYDLALVEAERALALSPDLPGGATLRDLLKAQLELVSRSGARESHEQGEPGPTDPVVPLKAGKIRVPVLTAQQVNLMKVYEVDLGEQPRVILDRGTVERMLEENQGNPLIPITKEGREALLRKTSLEHLDLMFRLQARNLYGRVEILDTPKGFRLFREDVQRTWLLNSCSTTQCHGGSEAGRLVLQTHRPNSDQTVYTNFLILSRYVLDDGTPLINWDNPERSPLLHMGLPREDALFRHPPAPLGVTGRDGWRRAFRSTDDPQYRRGYEWLKAMYHPRPEYPIEYTPARPFTPVGSGDGKYGRDGRPSATDPGRPTVERDRDGGPSGESERRGALPAVPAAPVPPGAGPSATAPLTLPAPSRKTKDPVKSWPRPPGAPAPNGAPPPEPVPEPGSEQPSPR